MRTNILENDFLKLTILPEAGCHWPELKVQLDNRWLDLLYPVEDWTTILTAPSSVGSYTMAPWSNRIPEGKFSFQGKDHQIRLNFPDNTTIHGDIRKRPWQVLEHSATLFQAKLDSRDFEDFNYPFPLLYEQSIQLKDNTVETSFFMTNTGQEEAPVGFGFHPFFKRQIIEGAEDPVLVLPARKVYPDEACIPTGSAKAVAGAEDLQSAKPLGCPNLDHCYTDLTDFGATLTYTNPKLEVQFKWDEVFSHTVIYVPQKENDQPGDFFAIEPVTHVNDGFNLYEKGWENTGIHVLKPGEKWGGAWQMKILKS